MLPLLDSLCKNHDILSGVNTSKFIYTKQFVGENKSIKRGPRKREDVLFGNGWQATYGRKPKQRKKKGRRVKGKGKHERETGR